MMKKKQRTKKHPRKPESDQESIHDRIETVDKNKARRKIRWDVIGGVTTSITAIISVFLAVVTVCQMKIDRDTSYRPEILINPVRREFSWDESGNCDWMDAMSNVDLEWESEKEGALHEGAVTVPIGLILNTVNVGVGTAKHIYFEWHESNIYKLNDYLIQCDESKNDFMKIDETVKVNYGNKTFGLNKPSMVVQMYMLPMANETYDIVFPLAYYLLIQEIIKAGGDAEEIPYIILTANYTDIQGKEYTDTFLFAVKITLRVEDPSGAGKATFELMPLFDAR